MFLTIVRHGQSTGNVSTDDIPDGELTPLGRQQARETAACLANAGITHMLCSPLVRALETASAIAEAAGVPRIEVWPELQEHRQSIHRGLGRAAILERFPNAVIPASVEADGWDHGGETYESALERGVSAMDALRARIGTNEHVAIATHGAFANYLLRALLRVPASHSVWFSMYNCGISRVRFFSRDPNSGISYETAEAEIISVNDVSHLSVVS
jgi:broad specificity phosphatase PhoE